MFISNAYAQAAGAAPSFAFTDVLLPIFMVVVVYFLMFRPQMKKQKAHQKLVSELQKGDEVITNSGITGLVSKVGDNYLTIEIAKGVEVQMQRGAVAAVLPKGTIKHL